MYPSKSQIRRIEWGAKHLWDLQFSDPSPPSPFNEWFPAVTVSENVYTMENHDVQFYLSNFSLPQKTAEFNLSVTYQDDVNLTLLRWFSDWVNVGILNEEKLVTPLAECARKLTLRYLGYDLKAATDIDDQPLETTYYVIPDGSANYEGEGDGGGHQYQLELKIVGKHSGE